MSKYWRIGTAEDSLSYYVEAPNRGTAIKLVEQITGPFNPSRVQCTELPGAPKGYIVTGGSQYVLEEDPEYDG